MIYTCGVIQLHSWHHMHSTVESVAGESRYDEMQASVRLQPMPAEDVRRNAWACLKKLG